MSFKIQLPDDRYLEIGLREDIDEEIETRVIPIEELEPESEESELDEVGARRGRRVARFLALGGILAGTLLLARSLRRRGRRESTQVTISEEDELAAQ